MHQRFDHAAASATAAFPHQLMRDEVVEPEQSSLAFD
jgi:hypothetical protein